MKTKLVTLLLLIASVANAQNARTILDKASEAYNKAGGITASFTLDTKDTKAKNTYSYDGKASMKGNKFKLEIPDAITWFDGTNQWVYIKDTDEVNVTNPTGEELQNISPSAIFSIYKKGFKLSYKGEKRVKGKGVHVVELTPENKKAEITKIVISIDKLSQLFSTITVTNKTGIENTLTINSMQTNISLNDSIFSFNKKEYPQVDIIDLR